MVKQNYLFLSFLMLSISCTEKKNTFRADEKDISESVYASGVVVSDQQYQVFTSSSGILKKILVSEGDSVSAGTPLFVIYNPTPEFNQKNAAIASDYSRLENNRSRISEAEANLSLTEKKMFLDSLNFSRQQKLWSQNIGTKLQLEQAELNFNNSKTTFVSAKARLDELKRQIRFNEAQSNQNLRLSEALVSDYTVKSEFSGKVYNILKKQGEMVNPQIPLAILGASAFFHLELQVDEYDIGSVKNGQNVYIRMDSYKNRIFRGKISKIYPYMNERSKSFKVDVVFTDPAPILFPNMSVEASIEINYKPKALTVPRKYMINDSMLILSNGDTICVQTGLRDYQKIEIMDPRIKRETQMRIPE